MSDSSPGTAPYEIEPTADFRKYIFQHRGSVSTGRAGRMHACRAEGEPGRRLGSGLAGLLVPVLAHAMLHTVCAAAPFMRPSRHPNLLRPAAGRSRLPLRSPTHPGAARQQPGRGRLFGTARLLVMHCAHYLVSHVAGQPGALLQRWDTRPQATNACTLAFTPQCLGMPPCPSRLPTWRCAPHADNAAKLYGVLRNTPWAPHAKFVLVRPRSAACTPPVGQCVGLQLAGAAHAWPLPIRTPHCTASLPRPSSHGGRSLQRATPRQKWTMTSCSP